jgi:hypothetical protein
VSHDEIETVKVDDIDVCYTGFCGCLDTVGADIVTTARLHVGAAMSGAGDV